MWDIPPNIPHVPCHSFPGKGPASSALQFLLFCAKPAALVCPALSWSGEPLHPRWSLQAGGTGNCSHEDTLLSPVQQVTKALLSLSNLLSPRGLTAGQPGGMAGRGTHGVFPALSQQWVTPQKQGTDGQRRNLRCPEEAQAGKDRGHSRNCILAFPGRRENTSSEPGTKPSLTRSSKGTAPSSRALISLFRQFANYFPGTVHPKGLCCGDSAVPALWGGGRGR